MYQISTNNSGMYQISSQHNYLYNSTSVNYFGHHSMTKFARKTAHTADLSSQCTKH